MQTISGQRNQCTFCGRKIDAARAELFPVPCNVRAFKHEIFHLWRCPDCGTLHCLEVVDLAHYYARYPRGRRVLVPPVRASYANLASRLTRHGMHPGASILDYGCNEGLFLRFLRENGYRYCNGYDRFSSREQFRDPSSLKKDSYDYVLLQDVLEHVEDPRGLLAELDGYLRAGGHILVGTPDAAVLEPRNLRTYWNQLHPPYHLHIFTRAGLESLGRERGWSLVDFYDRSYRDLKRGLNMRLFTEYQWLSDGTMDAVTDRHPGTGKWLPLRLTMARWFGYWYSPKGEMCGIFRKPVLPITRPG